MRKALHDWPIKFKPAPQAIQGDVEISFVIGHRGEERLPHLLTTLQTLFAQRNAQCEYIVVEQDEASQVHGRLPSGVRHLQVPPPDSEMPYSRSWGFNVGARAAKGQLLVFHDNDTCAPEDYGQELLRLYEQGYKAMRLQRFVFHLSKAATAAIFRGQEIDVAPSLTAITENEQGRTIAIDRDSFFNIGGFDEAFVGWGGEDNEFFERFETLDSYPYMYLPFVHLDHAPQAGKLDPDGRQTAALFARRSSIPVCERISELRRRGFGDIRHLDPPRSGIGPSMSMEPPERKKLHPLVEEVLTTTQITFPDGEVIQANSYIPRDECELIYRAAQMSHATQAIEVGMAYGVSTLCLCDALRHNVQTSNSGTPRLIAMDPAQHWKNSWNGVGLRQIERAGFQDYIEFHERSSQEVLPELWRRGFRCQLAFIDGWHTFDHTLVDFFYIDRMLEEGGIVLFDDVGYPAINALVRFILSNRDYGLTESLLGSNPVNSALRKRRIAKRFLRRLVRTDKDPAFNHLRLFRELEDAHSVALCKKRADQRPFDHYRPF
jgi:predicted O-methyltransferase YrrM